MFRKWCSEVAEQCGGSSSIFCTPRCPIDRDEFRPQDVHQIVDNALANFHRSIYEELKKTGKHVAGVMLREIQRAWAAIKTLPKASALTQTAANDIVSVLVWTLLGKLHYNLKYFLGPVEADLAKFVQMEKPLSASGIADKAEKVIIEARRASAKNTKPNFAHTLVLQLFNAPFNEGTWWDRHSPENPGLFLRSDARQSHATQGLKRKLGTLTKQLDQAVENKMRRACILPGLFRPGEEAYIVKAVHGLDEGQLPVMVQVLGQAGCEEELGVRCMTTNNEYCVHYDCLSRTVPGSDSFGCF
mmetsp:Transcript_18638/g.46795  ORF Transcript_18638/g.46795 Transcript_18638/m.46795 type:complete len:301 (-) Transcript_18638:199-1101(-)